MDSLARGTTIRGAAAGVGFASTNAMLHDDIMIERTQLHRDGYVVLRGAIPVDWLNDLRAAFDACVLPNDAWPVPRGSGWRHAWVDLDPRVRAACRLPPLLSVVSELVGERFFLAQVEGREPLAGGGFQELHRDLSSQRPGDTVIAIAYFDDYGPDNGATRIVPASHRPEPHATSTDPAESQALQLAGSAGDVLVFDADTIHAASCNFTGARRRSILVTYQAEPLHAQHAVTARLRGVRMDPVEWFEPSGLEHGA